TSARTLETIVRDHNGTFVETSGWTDIFIYPPYDFQAIDGLLTNFHLPKSTLIMLVSAFAGKDMTMRAYRQAIQERYRFFSFGRSEERRVGKEGRSRWAAGREKEETSSGTCNVGGGR